MPSYPQVGEPPLDRPIETRYFNGLNNFGAAYSDSFWYGDLHPSWRSVIADLFDRLNKCTIALLMIEQDPSDPQSVATDALSYCPERSKNEF